MSPTVEPSRRLVEYHGRLLTPASHTDSSILLLDDGGAFPDSQERGRTRDGRAWVRVPFDHVTRSFRRTTTAKIEGHPVEVVSVDAGALTVFHSLDPEWARARGMSGSQYEGGWHGPADPSELTDVEISEHDVALPHLPAHPA